MNNENLQTELVQLHQELSTLEGLDDATLEALRKVASDIDAVLERHKSETRETAEKIEGLREHIDDLAIRFDSEHPQLSGLLSRLTDALGNIGI